MSKNLTLRRFFSVLALALVMMFAATGPGFAAEEDGTRFKLTGDMDVWFSAKDGIAFNTASEQDRDIFAVTQRLRLFPSFIVDETLSLHALVRIKPDRWGDRGAGKAYNLDGDSGNIFLTRMVFANWRPYEKTQVHMGLIPMAMPFAAYRNGVLDSTIGGVSVNYEFAKGKNIMLAWGRAYDADDRGPSSRVADDTDLFMFKMPMKFEEANASFSPWAIYGLFGKESGFWDERVNHTKPVTPLPATAGGRKPADNGTGLWAGFAATYALGDLTFKGDAAYGQIKTDEAPLGGTITQYNTAGWFAGLKAEYKTPFGIPALYVWYASGSDADDVTNKQKWGVMPGISSFGDGFDPTNGFYDMYISFMPSGRMGVVAEMGKINFVKDLNHLIRVAYYTGTNDNKLAGSSAALSSGTRDWVLMVKDDYFIEFNLNNEYMFSKNTEINLEFTYINTNRGSSWGPQRKIDDVFVTQLQFTYYF